MANFLWGAAGEKMTPKQVSEQRRVAQALMARASDTSPVGHWTAAANRGLQGWLGGRDAYKAREAENAGMSEGQALIAALTGAPAAVDASIPTAAPEQGTASGDAFLNSIFKSESGGNLRALNSEGYGGRGQFGAARLADAARAGIIPEGIDGAAFSAMPEAVQAAVENWHFNDIDQQAERMGLNRFIGQTVGGAPITREAIRGMAHLGGIGGAAKFLQSGGQYNPSDSNGTSLLDYALRHGGTGAGAAPRGPSSNQIAAAMSNPWAMEAGGPVIQALMQQAQGRENAQLEQQMRQADPMYQAQLEGAMLANQAARQPQAMKPIEVNGQLVNPQTFEVIGDYRTIDPSNSERYRAVGGQIWDFTPEGGGAPALVGGGQEEIIYGPDGNPIVVRGPSGSGKPLTESQSKDVVFSTRAEGALRGLEAMDDTILTSRSDMALDVLPMGLGRELQSEEFQQAQNLGNEFLQAILRKDTGAAITEQEQKLYGDTYLPRPGDGAAVIEAKRAARSRAIAAMKAGMDPRQNAMTEQAIISAARRVSEQGGANGTPEQEKPATRRRYNPQTRSFE